MKMGQYWEFIAPGKWQSLVGVFEFTMSSFVFESRSSQWLAQMLIVPDTVKYQTSELPMPPHTSLESQPFNPPVPVPQVDPVMPKDVHEASRSSSALLSLPLELQILIIRHLSNIGKITLGIAYPHLWPLAVKEINAALLRNPARGPWAGEPLVLGGDYAFADDYPPEIRRLMREGKLPVEENDMEEDYFDEFLAYQQKLDDEEFGEDASEQGNSGEDEDEDSIASLTVSMKHTDKRYQRLRPWEYPTEFHVLRRHYMEVSGAPNSDLFNASITPDNCIPKDRPWILRNLTTRQFIHAEAVALKPSHINGSHIAVRGFGNVLAIRTGWSQDGSIGMNDYSNHGLTTGPWAGHCFDIVSVRMHEEQVRREGGDGKAWKDICEEIKDELDRIWEAGFEED